MARKPQKHPSENKPGVGGDSWSVTTLRRFGGYIWPPGRPDLRLRVVFAIMAIFLAKIITAVVPYFYKLAIDALAPALPGSPAAVNAAAGVSVAVMFIIAYAVGRVLMVAMAQLGAGLFARVTQNAARNMARETFEHLHRLSLRFHLERRTGALSRIMERGNRAVENIVRFSLFQIIPTTLELVLVFAVLAFYFSFSFSLVIMVTVVTYVTFTFIATEWRTRIRRQMNEADTESYSRAIDSLLNFETVKYFSNEKLETRRFDEAAAAYEKAAIKTSVSLSLLNSGQALIYSTGLGICMVMAGWRVAEGTITVGDFVMVNAYLVQMYQPLFFIGSVYRDIRQGLVDIENIFEVLAIAPELEDTPGAPPLAVPEGEVEFDRISFAYDAARPILRDVSFTVPPGKTLAIVGPSGAGKSTISRLIFRFYDVNDGAIRIDGQDIRAVTQKSLRSSIGMVPQDTVLFNDTIRYNILYGRADASEAAMREAARMAQIDDFILSLPEGYDTVVGERGLKLSGGEKQRVAIARTILKAPPILVLDEATSALDTATEKEIQSSLDLVAQNRTTIMIAHRLSTVVHADQIIVLDQGRVAERGDHATLMKKKGIYARLWEQQRKAQDEGLLSGLQDQTTVAP